MTLRVENLSRAFTRYVFAKRVSYSSDDPGGFLNEVFSRYLSRGVRRERVYAVRGVSFELSRGKVLVVIGPNGSGKTTLLRVLAGLLAPTEGRIVLDGVDLTHAPFSAYARHFTYIPGLTASGALWLNAGLTARRCLELYAEAYGLDRSRVPEVLELVGLAEHADARVGTFSTGMVGRLVLAAGLLKEASIYLMDEPLVGLSREVALDVMGLLRSLASEAKATVIYATNDLEEAERLADYVLFLHEGRQVFYGTLDEFRGLARRLVLEVEGPPELLVEALRGAAVVDASGGRVKAVLSSLEEAHEVLRELSARGIPFKSLRVAPPTVEEIYMHVIRRRGSASAGAGRVASS